MVDSRKKGARAELAARDLLRKYTGHKWERTPGSGALGAQHMLKGDLYIPNHTNLYLVEVKHYKTDQLGSNILVNKEPIIFQWWDKACEQADQTYKEPIVMYKWDRSKWYFILPIEYEDKYPDVRHIKIKSEKGNCGIIYPAEAFLEYTNLDW